MQQIMNPVEVSSRTGIWTDLSEALCSRYQILDAFDLSNYDHDMDWLRQQLEAYRSYTFSENQRIVFVLYETEYYLAGSCVGFTIENFVRVLRHLNISPGYCIFFTNYHGVTQNISDYYQDFPIVISENNFCKSFAMPDLPKLDRTADDILKNFCFMSNIQRDHRSYIRLWLEENNLTNKTLMSWHSSQDVKFKKSRPPIEGVSAAGNICYCVYAKPFIRINDKIKVSDQNLIESYQKNWPVLDHTYRDELILTDANKNTLEAPWLKSAFLNIVAETVFDYPYPHITEKTFKCFWHLSPFVIVGAANSLAYLKSIGFKTFDSWINEDYDQIENAEQRLLAVFDTLKTVSNWSISQCKDVYNSMKPVLEYNYQHYQEYFSKSLLDQNKKALDLI